MHAYRFIFDCPLSPGPHLPEDIRSRSSDSTGAYLSSMSTLHLDEYAEIARSPDSAGANFT